MYYIQVYSFKLLNQRFFVFNFQLLILISDFYYKYLISNPISSSIALNFLQSQNSLTSSVFNLRFLSTGEFSSSDFNFILHFQIQTSSTSNTITNVTLKLHTSIAFLIYNIKSQLCLSLAQLGPSLFL